MAWLFQVQLPTINEHSKPLKGKGGLQSGAIIRKFLRVRQDDIRQMSRK
jgi:hypothetical protein